MKKALTDSSQLDWFCGSVLMMQRLVALWKMEWMICWVHKSNQWSSWVPRWIAQRPASHRQFYSWQSIGTRVTNLMGVCCQGGSSGSRIDCCSEYVVWRIYPDLSFALTEELTLDRLLREELVPASNFNLFSSSFSRLIVVNFCASGVSSSIFVCWWGSEKLSSNASTSACTCSSNKTASISSPRLVDTDDVLDADFSDFKLHSFKMFFGHFQVKHNLS